MTGRVAAALVATAAALAASAAAAPRDVPNAFVCKVLREAVVGTAVGNHATHLDRRPIWGFMCTYTDGTDTIEWRVRRRRRSPRPT